MLRGITGSNANLLGEAGVSPGDSLMAGTLRHPAPIIT
ncbi:hypothetical protein SAMN05216316_1355 [Nitrosovibrio sp. Nv6]|nr:hypothetical protein SAMN05216316_1355 [Nitrosovibrio sp. Nv6]